MGEEETFAICDPQSASSCIEAMENIERYITAEGPFDGIMGFSQGTSIALGWLIQRRREASGKEPQPLPFKVGVFFSNPWGVYDGAALADGRLEYLDRSAFENLLDFPTAHIWGSADRDHEMAELVSASCVSEKRSTFVHSRGHEIPADTHTVIAMAKAINRAMVRAGLESL
ncbi:uncharacterized protein N7511_006887 [Penicillium nucicola]|uniref:uncharacterized protein n=1 Tax=Penicillium nucicola TaxID=1850975 RepID=UPI002544E959|nr:uncharacterized protein N7511_006887 [Penicillium nucicola]KAJ5758193.1 hypothetical protein N7511_006887 [Penicillium nucicola]